MLVEAISLAKFATTVSKSMNEIALHTAAVTFVSPDLDSPPAAPSFFAEFLLVCEQRAVCVDASSLAAT